MRLGQSKCFRRFSLCTPEVFSRIRKFLPSRRFQFLYRGKTKVDIKIRFFYKTKISACTTLKSFGKIQTTTLLILIRHSSLSYATTCVLFFVLLSNPEESCSKWSAEVIIIISKPRRRLTHTWYPFLLGMRKGNVHYLFTKNTQRTN